MNDDGRGIALFMRFRGLVRHRARVVEPNYFGRLLPACSPAWLMLVFKFGDTPKSLRWPRAWSEGGSASCQGHEYELGGGRRRRVPRAHAYDRDSACPAATRPCPPDGRHRLTT